MKINRKEMRKIGLNEYNYEEFKNWYSNEYDKEIHKSLVEFYQFMKEGASMEEFSRLNNEIQEWGEYNSKVTESTEKVENYVVERLGEYLQSLNEYGYIYETKNLSIGDSSEFMDGDRRYSVNLATYRINIGDTLNDTSFADVKQKSTYNVIKQAIDGLIEKKIDELSISGKLGVFRKSVKVVFEDLLIKKISDENGHYNKDGHSEVVIRLGIAIS
jgi:hypothetical protein